MSAYGKQEPAEKRARLRQAAATHLAQYGVADFNLHKLATAAGMKFEIARHHYRTNQALMLDVVRHCHATLGEVLADPILSARTLPPPERCHALITAVLTAMIDAGDWHRASMAVLAGYPAAAHELRNTDLWLVDELAEALEPGCEILARSLLILIEHWALRLGVTDAETRAECAAVLAGMVREGS